jgi:hypothetical protein
MSSREMRAIEFSQAFDEAVGQGERYERSRRAATVSHITSRRSPRRPLRASITGTMGTASGGQIDRVIPEQSDNETWRCLV